VDHGWSRTALYLVDRSRGAAAEAKPQPMVEGVEASFGAVARDEALYVRTNDGAPSYRLYAVDPARPARAAWREIVAARPDAVLSDFAVVGAKIVLEYLASAASRLEVCDREGRARAEVKLPAIGSVDAIGADWDGGEVFFGFSSYAVPPAVYRHDLATGRTELWQTVAAPGLDPAAITAELVHYPSKDGTSISMFLVRRKDVARDGRAPVLLNGYGGFNVAMTPAFGRSLYLFLERGGVYAVPHLRGGGEYGEAWHRAGMLEHKQNVFDDFIGAAEWLLAQRWTTRERLAILGGSNGGLLVGAAVTQRPELFRAAVSQVPLLDMLRYHRFLIAQLWIPEYGSPDDPAAFQWLRRYSPYHHVTPGRAYPAVLFATAESDSRVDPLHARKMAARLQAATSAGDERPILLRIETRAGHGAGKPIAKVLDEAVDTWTFLFWQLGLE
jgi:prolyl oligopeptidase